MPNPELVNAVGGGDLKQELDLQFLYEAIQGEEVRYDPEHWPGLYLQFATDSPAVMVFRTGKYNIAGADSVQELFNTNEKFLKQIQEIGIKIQKESFEIRNLVFLEQYSKELNLDQVVIGLGLNNAEYNPESFPGILFRLSNITGTFQIFANGKIILTGSTSSEDATDAFSELFSILDELFR